MIQIFKSNGSPSPFSRETGGEVHSIPQNRGSSNRESRRTGEVNKATD